MNKNINQNGGDAEFISNNIRSVDNFINFLEKHKYDLTNEENTIFSMKNAGNAVDNDFYFDKINRFGNNNIEFYFNLVENTNELKKVLIFEFLDGFVLIKKKGDDEYYKFSEKAINDYRNDYSHSLQPDIDGSSIDG